MKPFIIACLLLFSLAYALTTDDIRFLLDTEQFNYLAKHQDEMLSLLQGTSDEQKLLLEYAERIKDPLLALKCHGQLAFSTHSQEHALQWMGLAQECGLDSLSIAQMQDTFRNEFNAPEDAIVFDYYLLETPVDNYLELISQLRGYNPVIEDLAKSLIDDISVERSDSLALSLIDEFEASFPLSDWMQVAYYYRLFHLSQSGQWDRMRSQIEQYAHRSAVYSYISALYLISPTLRRQLDKSGDILAEAQALLDESLASDSGQIQVLYSLYTPEQWKNRLLLTKVKADYYQLLAEKGLYGDEETPLAVFKRPNAGFKRLLDSLKEITFANNDEGDLAELNFWRGKAQALCGQKKYLLQAAKSIAQALIYGSPRNKYDTACQYNLDALKEKLGGKLSTTDWTRSLMRYQGIVFEALPGVDQRYTRIAIGDYDNDSYPDLLFNGNALYHNDSGQGFTDVSDSANVAGLNSNGGLWADFNRDGALDFMTISHSADGFGEALMKNQDGNRFVKVNERAGDIDDTYPTEGAAWVDIDGAGYPSLYCANYEKWQDRAGYPDFFWYNDNGYFSDQSEERGFRLPDYADNPGLAGRGVAPADFDNDGHQEILVTDYRLNRNMCWKQIDSLFVDVAPIYGLTGKYKQGYFGHSIGADWGDYDNDGDLDLFVANLAHPRYIEISDVSQLLRNDGLATRVIGADTLYYWKFTDVIKNAGITYDELHSDPLWFDADNDGFLDLFITSVYENDRSYLYKNNGDGTFTDITWLANARIYNGWGNASGDLNRDGLPDLVVGSGNGAKVLINRSATKNRFLYVKPVWDKDKVALISDPEDYPNYHNSPAFGTRVKVTLKSPRGKIYSLIRELSSAKGTTSQNSQELHFGLGSSKLISLEQVTHAQD